MSRRRRRLLGGGGEAFLIDSWRFAEWEQAVWDRVESDYIDNCPIVRGTQIYIDQDASGNATGGGGTGTSSDPYLCNTWDNVCDLIMVNLTVSPDTAIILNDGDYYEGGYVLELPASNLTICTRSQYTAALMGEKEPAPDAKVFVNHFTVKIPTATSWTNSGTDTYYVALSPRVYTIRKQTQRLTDGEQFRIMPSEASLATLSGSQRGFWYDTVNNRVYIKVTAGEDPADFDWECVDGLTHGSNISSPDNAGTIHLPNSAITACRITGIRSDGYRFRHILIQGYGIKTDVSGSRFVVVDNCEAYFNCRHNMGCSGVNSVGGVTVYSDVVMGFCYENVATMFVHFNGKAGLVSYGRRFTFPAGSIPRDNTTNRALGRGAFIHAGAGEIIDRAYWFDFTATDHEFGVNSIAIIDGGATQAVDRDVDVKLSDMKAYFVRIKDYRNAEGSGGQPIVDMGRMQLRLNNEIYLKPPDGATSIANPGAAPRSAVAINCVQMVDMTNITSPAFGIYNGGGPASSLTKLAQLYNCFIGCTNVASGVTFVGVERSNTSSGAPPSSIFLYETRNCTFAKFSGAGTMRPGHGNNVGQNSNNAYFGVTRANNQSQGYNNVTDLVELTDAPWQDAIPQSGDQIFQAGNRPPKAREDREGFRFPTPPDIATRSSQALYSPNSILFDGTNDGLTASVGGSVTDATTLILSFKTIIKGTPSIQIPATTRNARISTRFISFGGLIFSVSVNDPAGNLLASGTSSAGVIQTDTPYIFLITASTSSFAVDPHFRCVFKPIGQAGAWITAFNEPLTSTGDIDFTDSQFFVGQGNGGANRFDGCLGDVYIGQGIGSALDTALQSKFLKPNGDPVQLGQFGERVTGTAPLIFLRNPFDSFEINNSNLGLQGNFTVTGILSQGDSFV